LVLKLFKLIIISNSRTLSFNGQINTLPPAYVFNI